MSPEAATTPEGTAAPGQPQTAAHYARLLLTLEQLLSLEAVELPTAMQQAAQRVAEVLSADKVDVFLYDARADAMVAVGTSDTPMGRLERALGLDRLPMANGGRVVRVFQTGESYLSRHASQDPEELSSIVEQLGICSAIVVPLAVATTRRGVLLAS